MATNIYGVKVSRKGLDIEKLYQNPEDDDNIPESGV